MPIKVNISLSSGGRFKPVSNHTLHEKRITVGRDKECTVSLEDTQKHVSRMHAEIEQDKDCYWIKVVSKVNPIAVNGKRYAYGDRVPIVEGDEVSVGLYKLEIIEAETAPPPKPPPAPPVVDESDEATVAPRPRAPPPQAPARPEVQPPSAIRAEEVTLPPAPAAPAPAAPAAKAPAPPVDQEEATYLPPVSSSPPPPTPAPKAPPVASRLPESAILDDEVTYIPPMWARVAGNKNAATTPDVDTTSEEDLTGILRGSTDDTRPPQAEVGAPKPLAEPAPASTAELDFDLSDAFDEPPAAKAPSPEPAPAPAPRIPDPEPAVEEDFSEDVTYVRRPSPKPPPAVVQPSPPPKAEEDFSEDATFVRRPSPKPPPAVVQPSPPPKAEEDFSEDATFVRRPSPKPPPAAVQTTPAPTPPSPVAPRAEAAKPVQEKAAYRSPMEEIQARIAAKSGTAKPKPAQEPAAASAAGPDKVVSAFLDGAGLSNLQVADPEAFMRMSGAMVRAAVGGILTLLADRAAARKELGLETDAGADDNPVTSMASPDEVIAFLFDPKPPAIANINPADAFSDACGDLRSHQAALVAGMRAAVMTTLLRIDPKKIEHDHNSGLGMLNITRKSKLWEISLALHEQFSRDVEQNFSSTFSAEILAAFAEHTRKARGG